MRKVNESLKRRNSIIAGGLSLSVLFILFQSIRYVTPSWPLSGEPSTGLKFGMILLFILFGALIGLGFFVLCTRQLSISQSKRMAASRLLHNQPSDLNYYWMTVLILFLAWLPVFLAYYPGIYAYDVAGQVPMHYGDFTNWHPLIHTLYLNFFYDVLGNGLFHNYTIGVAIGTIVQMILFAMQLAWIMVMLRRLRTFRPLRIFWLLFLMFMPFVSVMAVSMTKDVLFSGFFICVLCQVIQILLDPHWISRRRNQVIFVLSLTGMMLFRNTGQYVLIGFLLIGGFIWLRQKKKRVVLLMVLSLLLGWATDFVLIEATQVGRMKYNDAYSVPIQQIASVALDKEDELPSKLRREIKYLIPDYSSFFPYSSDPIRPSSKLVSKHKSEYLSVYFQLLFRYPAQMVSSFLLLTQAYWYFPDTSLIKIYHSPDGKEGFGYFQTYTAEGFELESKSLLPGLKDFYEHLFQYPDYAYLSNPILSVISSPALYIWLFLFCLIAAMVCKNQTACLPLILCLLMTGTIFLGPCALVRYSLPMMIAAPIFLEITFYNALRMPRRRKKVVHKAESVNSVNSAAI